MNQFPLENVNTSEKFSIFKKYPYISVYSESTESDIYSKEIFFVPFGVDGIHFPVTIVIKAGETIELKRYYSFVENFQIQTSNVELENIHFLYGKNIHFLYGNDYSFPLQSDLKIFVGLLSYYSAQLKNTSQQDVTIKFDAHYFSKDYDRQIRDYHHYSGVATKYFYYRGGTIKKLIGEFIEKYKLSKEEAAAKPVILFFD